MISGPWGHDRVWEREVIQRLHDGLAGPRSLSVYDAVASAGYESTGECSWVQAEQHAHDAIRTGAVYLDDVSIARRREKRALLKAAYNEAMAEERARRAEEAKKRAEMEAEQAREWEEHQKKKLERARELAERNREWELDWKLEHAIRTSRWTCKECKERGIIMVHENGYQVRCLGCAKATVVTREKLIRIFNL